MKTSARTHIAMEILQTEKAYVDFLRTLQEVYEIPCKSSVGSKKAQLMDQHEVSVCFGLLAPIYLGAGEFLVKLSNLMDRWDPDKTILSSLFLQSETYFQDYAPYVNSYTEISSLIHKLMEKNDFRSWIMEQRKLPRVADKYLIDFLIMPVQRIPRYSLLLRELVKVTPPDHPDLAGLNLALQKVDEIAAFLNEQKRRAEDFSRILLLHDKLTGKLSEEFKVCSGFRKIVREELVSMVTPEIDGSFREKKVTLVLLSDMMLVCDKKTSFGSEQYQVLKYWWLNEVLHTARPFVLSSSRKQVFQLLRRISGSGAAHDRRSLHLMVDDDYSSSSSSPALPTSAGSGSDKGISSLLLGSMAVVDALCQLGAGKAADVGGLAPLFLKRAQGGALLARLIRAELSSCVSESELFRVPSVRSVIVNRYLRLVCGEYVQNVLSPCFQSLLALSPEAVDVESSDLTVRSTIITQFQSFLDAVCNSTNSLTSETRQALSILSEAVAAKNEGAEIALISYLLLDKLFVAAISQPVGFGILAEEPSANHAKALDLIKAAFQKVTSRRFFDESSPVSYLNKIIGLYHRRIAEYLAEAVVFDKFSAKYPRSPKVPPLVMQSALMDLQACIASELPHFAKQPCYDQVAEAIAIESVGSIAQVESFVFWPTEMENKDPDIIAEHYSDWQKDLSKWVEESKQGTQQAAPKGVVATASKMGKKPSSNGLGVGAKLKETLSRFQPSEEEIHRNLRGKVLQSGYLWERRFFTVTEHGMFVQESPKSSEMAPLEIEIASAKVERVDGVAEWENALRLFNADTEFSLMADSEEEMFRWKNAITTLRVKEESKVVRKAQEAIQAVNSSSGKKQTSKPKKNSDTASAPSEKEMQLLGMIAGGSPSHHHVASDDTESGALKVKSLSSSTSLDSPTILKRDEKQQQLIRGTLKHKRTGSSASLGNSGSSLSVSGSPPVASSGSSSKSKFSTLVGRVKSELGELKQMHRRTESSSKIDDAKLTELKSPELARQASTVEAKPPVENLESLSRNSSPSVMIHASSPPQPPSPPVQISAAPDPVVVSRCEALFDFEPEEPGELCFAAGDVIEVFSFDPNGWGQGRLANGKVGEFPVNRVRFLDDTDPARMKRESDKLVSTLTRVLSDDDHTDETAYEVISPRALPPPPAKTGPPPIPTSQKPKLPLKKHGPVKSGPAATSSPGIVRKGPPPPPPPPAQN